MKIIRGQKGFTLVELAIVLVIIGIILGAVLKGQELINNAKVKRVYNQQREILAAMYTYYDKYGKFPGDDNTANTRPGWGATGNGNADGNIGTDGTYNFACTNTTASETCYLWEHLRLANIITGSGRLNPKHAYGGSISVSYDVSAPPTSISGANWIAFQNIPRDVAYTIDTQYDDGTWNSGSIQGSDDFTVAGAPITLFFKL